MSVLTNNANLIKSALKDVPKGNLGEIDSEWMIKAAKTIFDSGKSQMNEVTSHKLKKWPFSNLDSLNLKTVTLSEPNKEYSELIDYAMIDSVGPSISGKPVVIGGQPIQSITDYEVKIKHNLSIAGLQKPKTPASPPKPAKPKRPVRKFKPVSEDTMDDIDPEEFE